MNASTDFVGALSPAGQMRQLGAIGQLPGIVGLFRADSAAPEQLFAEIGGDRTGEARHRHFLALAALSRSDHAAVALVSDVETVLADGDRRWMVLGTPRLNLGLAQRHLADAPSPPNPLHEPGAALPEYPDALKRGLWRLAAMVARTVQPRRMRLAIDGTEFEATAGGGRLRTEQAGGETALLAALAEALTAGRAAKVAITPAEPPEAAGTGLEARDILAAHPDTAETDEPTDTPLSYDASGWPCVIGAGCDFDQVSRGATLCAAALAWAADAGASRLRLSRIGRGTGLRELLRLLPDGTVAVERRAFEPGETA